MVGASLHHYMGALGDRVFLSAHEAHFAVARERQKPDCEPARVLLQNERRKPVFQGNMQAYKKARRIRRAYLHQLMSVLMSDGIAFDTIWRNE